MWPSIDRLLLLIPINVNPVGALTSVPPQER